MNDANVTSSPYVHGPANVTVVMMQVVYALIPAVAGLFWFFGWGVLVNITVASIVALAAEAAMLSIRKHPVKPALADGSALVTALLLGMALPPLSPWWLITVGILFAIVIAKHLYGGLGFNPFNPAMVGYVALLISFPLEMTSWLPPASLQGHHLGLMDVLGYTFGGHLPAGLNLDTVTSATPLDDMKTQLRLDKTVVEVMSASPVFGALGGKGWEVVNGLILGGGLWLIFRKVIGWQVPAGMLGALFLMALIFHLASPDGHPGPLFHLFSGAAMLGAFFIATDPVSGATSPRGRLVFGAGVGILTFVIRTWGGYPDGVAFSVLLMNMAAPTIDYFTQPRVFGHTRD
jgi:electron transport complex protein RnfD